MSVYIDVYKDAAMWSTNKHQQGDALTHPRQDLGAFIDADGALYHGVLHVQPAHHLRPQAQLLGRHLDIAQHLCDNSIIDFNLNKPSHGAEWSLWNPTKQGTQRKVMYL